MLLDDVSLLAFSIASVHPNGTLNLHWCLLSSSSARSLFRSFVGSHISAFNCCKSQFRERVSQSMLSLLGYGRFRAYPCVDERVWRSSCLG
jgi:hypothetical protein